MRIGVDLGGTKIEVIALGAEGETLARRRIATPQDDYRRILEAVAALIGRLEAETGRQGTIGIGIPGALSRAIAPRAEDVVAAAPAGDARAEATLRRYEDRLARALATVINILDPDVIVLGGGLSKVTRLYRALPQRLPSHVFSDRVDTPVLPPRHGDASGARGAAWLWRDEASAAATAD